MWNTKAETKEDPPVAKIEDETPAKRKKIQTKTPETPAGNPPERKARLDEETADDTDMEALLDDENEVRDKLQPHGALRAKKGLYEYAYDSEFGRPFRKLLDGTGVEEYCIPQHKKDKETGGTFAVWQDGDFIELAMMSQQQQQQKSEKPSKTIQTQRKHQQHMSAHLEHNQQHKTA